ncbi:MAG: acyl-CoA dehydratase activase-related protein [Acidobacteriota bacterium]|jgi:predicted CoA-substrate-specific enzyme activase|nr:acyl-CoA dehydratase activase-related protein [Acidobacteriota bacterium]
MRSIGLDIGSTTLKAVLVGTGEDGSDGSLLFSRYLRHNADVKTALRGVLRDVAAEVGDEPVRLAVTGSVGMGPAQRFGLPFVQEVAAALAFVRRRHPDISTLIDIGGEDAKIIYLKPDGGVDLRMNGACAGGTGAFLDQMAILLGVDLADMDTLACNARAVHPIASRCGVFSKTDIQNLTSANVPREEIAASVFHAVALQTLAALSRGCEITPKVFLCGGPLTFLPALRRAFATVLGLPPEEFVTLGHAHLIPAWGAALATPSEADASKTFVLGDLLRGLETFVPNGKEMASLPPIFADAVGYEKWRRDKSRDSLPIAPLDGKAAGDVYLGIDSGSTTTKIVATDAHGGIVFSNYASNDGSPLEVVRRGLEALERERPGLRIAAAAATGYGEELVKAAFGLEFGLIETVAHYLAARRLVPGVSFILDIGGQDMKAIFVSHGALVRMEINEACSSGCGSFIETFARSLGHTAADFSSLACSAQTPADLGTRCTVFMNSKVKQALREGAGVEDIAAGLAYSVAKNCLYKVLKLRHVEELGDEIVVQGGAMRNDAVVAAFERVTGRVVRRPNRPELTGAYGAALYAAASVTDSAANREPRTIAALLDIPPPECSTFRCRGCENRCTVTRYAFTGGAPYVSGNKCEKVFHNCGAAQTPGVNIYAEKLHLLFDRPQTPLNASPLRIGIPRVLNMYEEYPFWHTLIGACGLDVVLSDTSTFGLYESGVRCVTSDNLCFPAKLVHGHILNLAGRGVDRIFMPWVTHEKQEGDGEVSSWNCPIVSGYSDVVKSVAATQIPIDSPAITFKDRKLLSAACRSYLRTLGVKEDVAVAALEKAELAQAEFEDQARWLNLEAFRKAKEEGRPVVLLAGRPYHADPLIQHKVADMIASLGVVVLTDDIVRDEAFVEHSASLNIDGGRLVRQWAYVNRILRAAEWVARKGDSVQFAQLTSFGCGPDAFLQEEVDAILRRRGKAPTLLKIDDMTSAGALKLRVRSLVESRRYRGCDSRKARRPFPQARFFAREDRRRTLLVPFMSEFIAPLLPPLGRLAGYDVEVLPQSTNETSEIGLRYANNEVCYPATLVVGDIIHALQDGGRDLDKTAVLISQTGGQCRASNYIALIRGAMSEAGFADVPVLGLGFVEKAKGLGINWRRLLPTVFFTILFADVISRFHHAAVVREKVPGLARALTDKYLSQAVSLIERADRSGMIRLLALAAREYDAAVTDAVLPKVGLVGEIFLKLNSYANRSAAQWLMEQGVEVSPPGLLPFFMQTFVNLRVNAEIGLSRTTLSDFLLAKTYHWAKRQIARTNAAGRGFRYFTPFDDIFDEAACGAEVVNLAAQFGEGWLLPAETVSFAKNGVSNVICLQPFGCISNHIVAKGVEKKIKTLYPHMNLLALDYDGGTSQVNITNRLLLFLTQIGHANAGARHTAPESA